MINILTVDVEDYHWIFARDFLIRETPISTRVVEFTGRLLDVLEGTGVTATFFCLGNVARRYPELIREIHNRGFEVGSHGMDHLLYGRLDIGRIKNDISAGKSTLEDILGEPIPGFRAPHFNVSLSRPQVLECIIEAGHKYDSSIFPFSGWRYGSRESPRGPYRIQTASGMLSEFPLATVRLAGRRFPVAGGGYLRHFPYRLSHWAVRSLNRKGLPVTVYLHPYEFDTVRPEYSRTELSSKTRWRAALFNLMQYHGRGTMLKKARALVRDFPFSSISSVLADSSSNQLPVINLGL